MPSRRYKVWLRFADGGPCHEYCHQVKAYDAEDAAKTAMLGKNKFTYVIGVEPDEPCELEAKNAAQQQEIERLKAEELAQRAGKCAEQKRRVFEVTKLQAEIERLREELATERNKTPSYMALALAAQGKGERAVDVEALARELAEEIVPEGFYDSAVEVILPILRRHLEPQGETESFDVDKALDDCEPKHQPTIDRIRKIMGKEQEAQAVAPTSSEAEAMDAVYRNLGKRSREIVAAAAASATEATGVTIEEYAASRVAPASPVRAEETHEQATFRANTAEVSVELLAIQVKGLIRELKKANAELAALRDFCGMSQVELDDFLAIRRELDRQTTELAALRKQVEEGERDTKRLDKLASVTWNTTLIVDDWKGRKEFRLSCPGMFGMWSGSIRQAIDDFCPKTAAALAEAATPEPKEPA